MVKDNKNNQYTYINNKFDKRLFVLIRVFEITEVEKHLGNRKYILTPLSSRSILKMKPDLFLP